MSVDISITTHITGVFGNETKEYGDTETPVTFTLTTGLVHETRAVVTDNYIDEVLWTTGDGNLDTFELLWFLSDADVFIELRNTQSTDEFILIEVKANVPLILTSDDIGGYQTSTRFDDGALVEATDFDQCDQITVQRNVADAAGDATVHLVLMA